MDKAAYEELWLLFDIGEKICSPLRQARTVVRNDASGSDSGSESGPGFDYNEDVHFTRRRYVPQAYLFVATTGSSPLYKSWALNDVEVDSEYLSKDSLLRNLKARAA